MPLEKLNTIIASIYDVEVYRKLVRPFGMLGITVFPKEVYWGEPSLVEFEGVMVKVS